MSAQAIAVPFRTKLPSDWRSGKEVVFTERRVDGILKLTGDDLVLEIRVTEATTRLSGSAGYATDETASDVAELTVPLDRVAALRLRKWWWGPRLTIVTDSLRFFENVPGSKQGRLDLRIARRDLAMAQTLVTESEIRLADLSLRRVEGDPLSDQIGQLGPAADDEV